MNLSDQLLSDAIWHYQNRIVKRSLKSSVIGPTIRLVCFCQQYEILLEKIDSQLDCQTLLRYMLRGCEASPTYSKELIPQLRAWIDRVQFDIFLDITTNLHSGPCSVTMDTVGDQECCRRIIKFWKDYYKYSESF